ncbi:ABC transporter permease [Bacillus thuringiensis]|jgi:ABC-2 type transport system permease protein|nr:MULTISPECIES: ABC transporter permease [Bacillus]MCA1001305.1 ABC transporter permease [Bacillus thuringiensis]MDA1771624.1 ABC transporter permease [Bacillus cereus]MDA2337532.1 ABC transporter permease [Bacillus cereus]MDA2346867.1 ABC transporter permease [Bacillus cereus]MDA2351947.1 ABC transporter permease [Bacillus cereus]
MLRYLPNTISELVIFYLVFLGFFLGITLVGDPNTIEHNIQLVILNYVFWFLILTVTQGIGWEISNEAGQGTLEQLYLTPYKLSFILLTRMISTILINLVTISFLLFGAMLTANQWLNIDLISILPILCITLIGVFGIGYAIAGITMILKQVDYILQLFQFIIMGLTFIPLTVAPFLKYGPFMLGLQLIRDIAINKKSLFSIGGAELLFLIVNACIYLVIGLIVFWRCEKIAKNKGLFGHY